MTADDIIYHLALAPHPEGGWYRQTWSEERDDTERPSGTAIYYLLARGQQSHWHKVDAAEIWHFYAGAPLTLSLAPVEDRPAERIRLGPDILNGEEPQVIVPKLHWQSAVSTGDWSLVGCTVSPGFLFEGFTLAPSGFDIPPR